MSKKGETGGIDLGRYRPYLSLLARVGLDPRFQAKFDPSDIVQETLLKAHNARDRARSFTEEQMPAWLRKILANSMANAERSFRAKKRRIDLERRLEATLDGSSDKLFSLLKADESSPSQHAESMERGLQLAEALDELPERQREAIVLHHWQGLSVNEIAERLGTSPGAVTSLLRRGLEGLRKKLGTQRN
jgi:RNA polymerase sigma-70 factor (ECF subfamily)